MLVAIAEYRRGDYVVSTDIARLDVDAVHELLSRSSYWARGRSLDGVERSVEHSLCFGVYLASQQVGLARVVTDQAISAWLCDVFIVESHRDQGLGKSLVECVAHHPELQGLYLTLVTRDAHERYRRYGGFQTLQLPERWMERPRTLREARGS
jgi:GNAT superfamily N-acetyltransferase